MEQADEGVRLCDVLILRARVGDGAVLDEDGAGGGLEEDVGARIASGELLLDFEAEVVLGVLGLPVAAREMELVNERAVNAQGVLAFADELILGDERPVELASAFLEHVFEGAPEITLVVEAEFAELVECFVIGADGSVRWPESELRHTEGV